MAYDVPPYRDDLLMTLKDDAATVNALVRRTPRAKLEERRFDQWSALDLIAHVAFIAGGDVWYVQVPSQ